MSLTEWGKGAAIEKGIYFSGWNSVEDTCRLDYSKERKNQFLNRFSDLSQLAQIFLPQWLSHFELY
jgi:hypothetical protein